ncbi:MAG: transcription antitermination factor NusB [Thermodesulfobacteriota bacterium]
MGHRHKARVLALQVLYQIDLTGDPMEESMALLCNGSDAPPDVRSFARDLVRGVRENMSEIDRLIRISSEHWRVERMAIVDRNILRLAVYELLFRPEVPSRVAMDEAIDLGKEFGTAESGAFINGVLDHIYLSMRPMVATETT